MFGNLVWTIYMVIQTACFVNVASLNVGNHLKSEFRIIHGISAAAYEFPYYVQILTPSKDEQHFSRCGGVLVKPNKVITAKHCVRSETLKANIFTNDPRSTGPPVIRYKQGDFSIKFYSVLSYETPPALYPKKDIAVITLTESVPLGNGVSTIKITDKDYGPGTMVTFCGLGATETTKYANSLLKITLPILSSEACGYLDKMRGAKCVEPSNKNSQMCFGDSGGPSVIHYDNPKNDILLGVISGADPYLRPDSRVNCDAVVNYFTDIYPVRDWLFERLNN